MKKILKPILTLIFFITTICFVNSQVSGLSYTLSPYGEYSWTGDQSGLKNGYSAGAMLGMGFGEFVELRANYAQGIGYETDLSKFGFSPTVEQLATYSPRSLDLSKYGGELKLNLGRGKLFPYLTLGTGVQSIGFDSVSTNQQIYLNAGLGINFSAGDRYTIGVQAINSRYNYRPISALMDASERETYGLDPNDFLSESVSNWALRASLILYIGGRKPGEKTAIDEAYWDNFSGGFRGLNVPLEFQASYMDFHKDLPYRDTWMAGGSAGLNFGPLVGVRGFYWRALEDGSNTKFDELAMYGGEARFLLNEGKGFTPWLTIGAGNIYTSENYIENFVDTTMVAKSNSKGFAMGGLGIDIPFSKYIKATGFARSVLTTGQNFELVSEPEELKASWNYGVSINFILGRKKKKIEVVEQSKFDDYILATDAENIAATEELKKQYEDKIKALQGDLNKALIEQDQAAIDDITKEKKIAQKVVDQLNQNARDKIVQEAKGSGNSNSNNNSVQSPLGGEIRMSPAEFNLLLRDLMDGINKNGSPQNVSPLLSQNTGNQNIQDALSDYKKDVQLEKISESLKDIKSNLSEISKTQTKLKEENKVQSSDLKALNSMVDNQITRLSDKLGNISKDLELLETRQKKIEEGISSNENIEIQSFETIQLQRDIDFTNEKIDALKEMMLDVLSNRTSNGNTGMSTNSGNDTILISEPQISNSRVIKTAPGYDNSKGFFSKFQYNGMSGFAGFNVGGNTTFNLGYRLHYKIAESNLEFVPETFFGFGSPSAFGISANAIYKMDFITKSKTFVPYAGLGLGFMKVGDDVNTDKLTGAWNFIIGTSLNVFAGDLYVDLTARNSFKYNQLIVGYRFPF